MRKRALICLCCLLLSIKSDRIDADEQQDCVESCKEGSHERLDDHCYYWSASTKSWEDSESFCKSWKGHLAAVTSLEIHDFLMKKATNALSSSFWIGGSDQDREGTWKWTDKTNFSCKYLYKGEPNNKPHGTHVPICIYQGKGLEE